MPYVFNKERINEIIRGLSSKLHFNHMGYAHTDDEAEATHFASIPGYTVHDALPEEAGAVKPADTGATAATDVPPTGNQPAGDPNSEHLEFVAGKTKDELLLMTKAALVDFANDLGIAFPNPRMTNAEMVDYLLQNGNQ